MEKTDKTLRKRQQISKANKTMFLWVAAGSGVVGIALVLSVFLIRQLVFNEEVLFKKNDTIGALQESQMAVPKLREAIAVKNTDKALLETRAKDTDKPLQVIIDALPDTPNTAALGASLQSVLIPASSLQLDSLKVDPLTEDGESGVMSFSFSVSTNQSSLGELRNLQQRLERSIRAIKVTSVLIETSGTKATMSVTGVAYYEPARELQLGSETVEP